MKFVGEEADDSGGPRREYWALLAEEIRFNICESNQKSCVLRHDSVGLMVNN